MKLIFRSIVAGLLAIFARAILMKYKPKVVMITGSVGKTSTKDAVASALSIAFNLRASEKSYNSEFGVPLTIIGAGNPWYSASAWLRVFQRALSLIFFTHSYPELLVLEVGADRPGDVKHILRIVSPDAVVVTRLPDIPVHVEAYASAEAVREEEFAPAYTLSTGMPLVICADDHNAVRKSARLSATLFTFGFAEGATVKLSNVRVVKDDGCPIGMAVDAEIAGEKQTLKVPCAVGRSQIFAPAAALALATALGVETKHLEKGLSRYEPPSGRGKVLDGVNGSILIDDTYNASPAAVQEILSSLPQITAKRRVVILGDMLELGRYSKGEHEKIGRLASEVADVVVSVGVRAQAIASSARESGKTEVLDFPDSYSAVGGLKGVIQEGDVVLIKGSQSIRMERIVASLLNNPTDTSKLVRQEKEWQKIP